MITQTPNIGTGGRTRTTRAVIGRAQVLGADRHIMRFCRTVWASG